MIGYKIALFVHILSIATWFGGLTVMAVWLRKSTALHQSGISMSKSLENVHNLNVRMMVPVAVLALAAGMYMLVTGTWGADQPLWLTVKERFGSLFVLLYIIGLPLYGGKLLKKVQSEKDESTMASTVKRYIGLLNFSLLAMLVIIVFVTFQIV
ncbi:hypothetical protein [Paludifilum halophilum]|nr:hypothetical protein [Paludifilum halophilum]